uniref:Uncharacterized protein n=1 Tax=Brassica oleracea TaxID=3712 RepID=A0A3P6DXU2_BRAOL|nr:unnamed protein product [Brassica oleracea]
MNMCVLRGDSADRVKQKTIRLQLFKNEPVVPCGLTCWKNDCNWRRRCDLKVLECLTIPEISGGICAERGLLGVTTCATILEERVRSYANHQNQDSFQLVFIILFNNIHCFFLNYTTNHLYCPF